MGWREVPNAASFTTVRSPPLPHYRGGIKELKESPRKEGPATIETRAVLVLGHDLSTADSKIPAFEEFRSLGSTWEGRCPVGLENGLQYLHDENVILTTWNQTMLASIEDGNVKLSDFGFAREVHAHMIPNEIAVALLKPIQNGFRYYSFGVLLWEICTLQTIQKVRISKGYVSKGGRGWTMAAILVVDPIKASPWFDQSILGRCNCEQVHIKRDPTRPGSHFDIKIIRGG